VAEAAPPEAPKKLPLDKILAVVVIILVVVAAWGWLRPVGPTPVEEIPNTPPTAVGVVDRTVGDVGQVFSFDGSGSSDPDTDDEIVMWEWDFGDGTIIREVKAKGGDGKIDYVYSSAGDYVVGLTVYDKRGASANNDVSLITIKTLHPNVPAGNGTAPFAILSADKTVIEPNTTVSFDATSSWVWKWFWINESNFSEGGYFDVSFEDLTYTWFFGDGTVASGATVDHTFTLPGNYPVKLVVSTADGRKDVAIKTVRVLEPGSPFEGVIKNPDAYVIATIGEPETLDPAKAYDTASGFIIQHVTEPLIWYNKGSVTELIPWLATNVPSVDDGTIFNDGRSYKFFIRPNVKFHTGRTLTAEDVEYSIERMIVLDPPGGPMWMLKEALFGVENTSGVFLPYSVIDAAIERDDTEQSVTLHLKEPFAPFLQVMAFWVGNIIDKQFAIEHGDWDGTAADAEARFGTWGEYWDDNLVGTGPYKFVRWDRRQQVLLERFDDYWGGNFPGEERRPAKLKNVVYKLVEEFSTRKLLLLSGDVDVAYIPIQFEEQVTGIPELRIYRGLKSLVASPFLAFNQRINKTYAQAWVGNLPDKYPEAVDGDWLSWFEDKHLRLAFSYAFDVQSFIDEVLRGNAQQINSPIPEGLLGYNATSPAPREFDLNKAAEHMKLAWNGKVWTEGFEFSYLYNCGNTAREAIGNQLKTNIEALNAIREQEGVDTSGDKTFKINVECGPWGSVYLPALFNFGLTAFALGWIADYADPHNFMQPFLHSAGVFAYFMGFSNATVDSLIEQAVLTTDPVERISLYQQVAEIAHDEAIYAFIIQSHGFRVERTWVKGWYFNPMLQTYVWALDKF
jgi:peptide/nickel transport system substrate-binding protein